jgi:transglutaminase-like putative cysteine protease
MKIRIFLVLLFGVLFLNVNAQSSKLGKVSVAELEEKVHPVDSSATAAILYNKARTFFSYDIKNGFSINTENTFRIKIYKKEGLKWANYKLPYRIGYEKLNDDRVEFSDCVTYNLENGNVVVTKLKGEGIFKTSVNKYWKEAAIALPNVKVGSIIEFKYIVKSENIVEFPGFNFQYEIPVNYSECVTEIPGFFVYKAVTKGGVKIETESKVGNGSLTFANQYDQTRSESVTFNQVNSKYIIKNIVALKEEPFVDNIQNYRISIFHELEKTQFYQEPVKDYSKTWEGVAKTIYEDKDFGTELKERQYVDQDLAKILKNEASETEKMEVIFKFVQNKMNWNNQKGYYTDKGVKKAYIDGTGNTAEINFILMAMLNRAGIKTEPVLISTTENGIPVYPSRTVFNYVLAAVEIEGKRILLDATNKQAAPNILPLYTLNWTGRLIRQNGTSEEINLNPTFLSKKTLNMMVSVDEKGKLSGKYRVNSTDYEAFTFREKYAGVNQQNYLEKVENDFPGIQISEYNAENNKDLSKPIIENFTFTADNQSELIGDKIYLDPLLFFTPTKNPFVLENRDLPIYFGYPTQFKYNLNIAIPDGYVVETLPKPINLLTGENVGLFTFNISVTNNTIQVVINKEIKSVIVSADFYDTLKVFYKQMIDKLNEKIVLKKI